MRKLDSLGGTPEVTEYRSLKRKNIECVVNDLYRRECPIP